MKSYLVKLRKGLPWSLSTFVLFYIILYYPKIGFDISSILLGLGIFILFAGPLFVILKEKFQKNKEQ